MPRAPRVLWSLAAGGAGVLLACGAAACGSGSPSSAGAVHGTADVAFADSLQLLYASTIQPSFQSVSGDRVHGRGGGSTTLAQEIVSGEITPGVFVSVGKKAMEKLFAAGKARFFIQLATNPLVVAYNPHSRYAPQLEAIASGKQPLSSLFTLLAEPGLRLGRTDPNADPQGVYFLLMCKLAQHALGLPSDPASTVLGVNASEPFGRTSQMVDATALVTDLEAGEFDVTSAYLTQAVQYKLPYITLPASLDFADPAEATSYASVKVTLTDGTVDKGGLISLNVTLVAPPAGAGAPSAADVAADGAFVGYLLSAEGQSDLRHGGYTVASPVFHGATSAETPATTLPASVLSAFQAAGGTVPGG